MTQQMRFSTINYGGKDANIFQFYSSDLDGLTEYEAAVNLFKTLTFSDFLKLVTKKELNDMLSHIKLHHSDLTKPIINLVKENKIHWGGDNKAGRPGRPNAINLSASITSVPTQEEIYTWYSNDITNFMDDLKEEATKYLGGDVGKVIAGVLVYDLMCNHVYSQCNLSNVRKELRRVTEEDEMTFEINKFTNIVKPHYKSDIIAIQETIDFNSLNFSGKCWGKSPVLSKNKKVISGTPKSNISLIVDTKLYNYMDRLIPPDYIKDSMFLRKTSCFRLNNKNHNMLIVVLHMKNPKEDAAKIATLLKKMIDEYKSNFGIEEVIVLGDSNLESKHKFSTENLSNSLGLTKVSNSLSTTRKKRTFLQAQVDKAEQETSEEKDFIAHSPNLNVANFLLYPNTTSDYYPCPEWQTDHLALSVSFVK